MTETYTLETLVKEKIEQGQVDLPVFDDIALKIEREVREQRLDSSDICEILEEDPGLVSELLRVANSSFFAGLEPVASLTEASFRLGVRQIASIVFSVSHKRMYSASKGMFKTRLEKLWEHSATVAEGSRWLAANTGYRSIAEVAYVAGLLHDVGKLSLICIIEAQMVARGADMPDEDIDRAVDGLYCNHGADLATMWNLPDVIIDTIRRQNDEHPNEGDTLLCMLRFVHNTCVKLGLCDQIVTNRTLTLAEVTQELLESDEACVLGLREEDVDELLDFLLSKEELTALAA